MDTRLPAPSLVVLVGPSASGKTTWAVDHFAGNEIVSLDTLRAMVGTGTEDQEDRSALRERIDQLRGRNTSVEDYSSRYSACTPDDHIELFSAYAKAGASHSIVALPDVHLEGSIEAFADVIAGLASA